MPETTLMYVLLLFLLQNCTNFKKLGTGILNEE
jgi:hypothetical protein